ncbi:hypothetical protein Ami103574_03235 [Aminipila butyrica]|uniref:Uncharacterized protein n=1 Tax=Aminipila butyrica TaxID=433296 RepID=A0A858BT63_9FIRM|nr:hypothetical protein [Aminipila butyrica]QIB68389.1 hypothetical protein Ami103574_03235 [Aminipila butyrica]
MKITGNYFNTQINKKNTQGSAEATKPVYKQSVQNRDSITINASKEQIAEAQFANSLKSQIAAEVRTSASAEKLDGLAQQISRGEYEINANDIVKKLLMTEADF